MIFAVICANEFMYNLFFINAATPNTTPTKEIVELKKAKITVILTSLTKLSGILIKDWILMHKITDAIKTIIPIKVSAKKTDE